MLISELQRKKISLQMWGICFSFVALFLGTCTRFFCVMPKLISNKIA